LEEARQMADENGSGRATWFVIAVVLLGVLMLAKWPGRRGFASDGGDHPRLAGILGSAQRFPETDAFTGAEMTALMGSCALDLRRARMLPGTEATIDIFAMMGSVTIRVPDGWRIDTHAVPVMGSIRNDRWPAPTHDVATPVTPEAPRLLLRGLVMMGSIFIKS
jgi:hypothetical protein